MIKNLRVDKRLLHGQTTVFWLAHLGVDCVLIASDSIVKDNLRLTTVKLNKPVGAKLVIKNIQDSIDALNSGATDKYKLFIIVENVRDAYQLVKNVPFIEEVTLGYVKSKGETIKWADAIFINEKEIEMVKEMLARGVKVECHTIPTARKIDAQKLI